MAGPIIIPSQYGIGEIAPIPDRPRPAPVEPRRLDRAGVQRKFGWSDAQFEQALTLNFPAAGVRSSFGNWKIVSIWNEALLDAWAVEVREKAAAMIALVGQ